MDVVFLISNELEMITLTLNYVFLKHMAIRDDFVVPDLLMCKRTTSKRFIHVLFNNSPHKILWFKLVCLF